MGCDIRRQPGPWRIFDASSPLRSRLTALAKALQMPARRFRSVRVLSREGPASPAKQQPGSALARGVLCRGAGECSLLPTAKNSGTGRGASGADGGDEWRRLRRRFSRVP